MVLRFINSFRTLTLNRIKKFGINEIDMYHKGMLQRKCVKYTTINHRINALKLYYYKITGIEMDTSRIERPKKSSLLPNVYSVE